MKKILKALKQFNNNNAGVTLVELIIAVIVLSIAIGPLLYTFVFSTRFNASSKIKQRSTTAAQTVIENFKANDVKEVYQMFQGVSTTNPDGSVTVSYPSQFIKNGDAMGTTYSFTSAGLSDVELGTYEVIGMSLSDVTTKDFGKYDAVITVNAGLTNSSMPEVPVYDPRQDALWQENNSNEGADYYDPYNVASDAVRAKITSAGLDILEVKRIDISREIYVLLSSGLVQYKYPYTITMNSGAVYTGVIERPTDTMVTTDFSMSLRNVYFYYYPAYRDTYSMVSDGNGGQISSTSVNVISDKLIISNTANENVNLYVYKQLNSVKNFFKLKTSENLYNLNVVSQGSSYVTKVYDCVQANLADIKNGDYASTMPSMLTTVNGSTENVMIALQSKIGDVDSSILSYNINVKIYKNGDRTEVLSEMNGTVLK